MSSFHLWKFSDQIILKLLSIAMLHFLNICDFKYIW